MYELSDTPDYQPPLALDSTDYQLLNQILGSYRLVNSRSGRASTLSFCYRPGQLWQTPPIRLEIAGCIFWISIPGISAVPSVQELLQGTPWSDLNPDMQLAALDVAFSSLLSDLDRAGLGDVLLNACDAPPATERILDMDAVLETGEQLRGQLSGPVASLQWLGQVLGGTERVFQQSLDHLCVPGELLIATTELSLVEIGALEVGDAVLVQRLAPPSRDFPAAEETLESQESQDTFFGASDDDAWQAASAGCVLQFRGLQVQATSIGIAGCLVGQRIESPRTVSGPLAVPEWPSHENVDNKIPLEIRSDAGRYALGKIFERGQAVVEPIELHGRTDRCRLYHGPRRLATGQLLEIAGQCVLVIDGVRTGLCDPMMWKSI